MGADPLFEKNFLDAGPSLGCLIKISMKSINYLFLCNIKALH